MPFIGPIPIGFLRIPSPSSLCLARRNVRNSSGSLTVHPYTVLPFLIHSSSTDPGQQSSLSYTRMVAQILLRVGMFCFCIDCTESPSNLVHAAHWRQVHFRPHRPLPRDISHMHTAKHTPILVANVEAVCVRFEELGVQFKKRLTDGKMKNIAFILDPDG